MAYLINKRKQRLKSDGDAKTGTRTIADSVGALGTYNTANIGGSNKKSVYAPSVENSVLPSSKSATGTNAMSGNGSYPDGRAGADSAVSMSKKSSGSSETAGFEDAYNRMITVLNSYGVSMALPTFDELYAQLESLLRPSVDAAIEQRQKYGDTALAELDADAYSRGMGGSSYLSSMKLREYDNIASDVAKLEAGYTSDLSEYLYNATNELNKLQSQFAALFIEHEHDKELAAIQHEYAKQLAAINNAARYSGNGNASGSSEANDGETDPDGQDEQSGEAVDYFTKDRVYFEILSDEDKYNAFHSNDEYWRAIRAEITSNISPEEYEKLRKVYDRPGGGNDRHGIPRGGESNWTNVLW